MASVATATNDTTKQQSIDAQLRIEQGQGNTQTIEVDSSLSSRLQNCYLKDDGRNDGVSGCKNRSRNGSRSSLLTLSINGHGSQDEQSGDKSSEAVNTSSINNGTKARNVKNVLDTRSISNIDNSQSISNTQNTRSISNIDNSQNQIHSIIISTRDHHQSIVILICPL